jgi:hypothetical protein
MEKKILLVTGASQNHYKTLKQFLTTVNFNVFDCIVYDLGLEENTFNDIKKSYKNIIYKTFNYDKYPAYYNININAGEYAWKPALIKEVTDEYKTKYDVLFWSDSGNKLTNMSVNALLNEVNNNLIYSGSSSGDIRKWTYRATYKWFGIADDSFILNKSNRNGAIIAFKISDQEVIEFIDEFARCAAIKDCIAPDGSSRQNHRQDQAVLTILYWMWVIKNNRQPCSDSYLGITIHNDID